LKKLATAATSIAVLLAGIGAAFQAGKNDGFKTGSEWALVQADIVAREAGVFMPVYMKDGNFRVVIKQPRGIYKRAWELADQHEEAAENPRSAKLERVMGRRMPENEI
jgi:hypothetical protein